jgi:drug/metabolite transporter (DMT)-like permease
MVRRICGGCPIPIDAFLAVLAAAFLHAAWNAMAKGGGGRHPLAGPFLIGIGAGAWAIPLLVVTGLPDPASYPLVAASAAIHVAYFGLIGLAYRFADYSAVYPLIRGGAPLFTTMLAAAFLGETLTPAALAGVALLCVGILGLGADGLRQGSLDRRSLLVAAATATIVVAYTLVDGLGARASGNPAAYVLAMSLATAVALAPVFLAIGGRDLIASAAPAWRRGLLGGGMANLSYGIALWAMTKAPIGLVGAVRETSVLFATLIAAIVLKERFGPGRWAAAAVIVAGLMLSRAG